MEEGQGYFPVKIYPYRRADDMGIQPVCSDTGSACYYSYVEVRVIFGFGKNTMLQTNNAETVGWDNTVDSMVKIYNRSIDNHL